MRIIKIAMIQLENHYQNQELGYEKAASLITQAAKEEIDIAILPELSGCGYIPNQSIWKYAEPSNGRTSIWACELSAKLKIYVGAGFIEFDKGEYYNSYLLSNPEGNVCGIIRKEDAESYCFKRERGDLYIDTDIGRIGVGICADNHYIERLNRMKNENIDFMIMPHASPSPYKKTANISEKDIRLFDNQPYKVASTYSNFLRIPTVFVNATGDFPNFLGGYGVKSFNENFQLMGGSIATNSDGQILSKMSSSPGYAIVELVLHKNTKEAIQPTVYHKKWLHSGNALYRCFIMPKLIKKGIKSYEKEHSIYMKEHQTQINQ